MKVTVRYFASIREALGASEVIEIHEACSVAMVRDALIARGGAHASALQRGKAVRSALNQVLCDESVAVGSAGEIAFFPPVTGG